jgi:hypothetical protein
MDIMYNKIYEQRINTPNIYIYMTTLISSQVLNNNKYPSPSPARRPRTEEDGPPAFRSIRHVVGFADFFSLFCG